MLKFSIVIPNWNGKELLQKNLPAVLNAGADEVMIVDDGSTDGSVEMIKKIKKNKNIKLIENKRNIGFVRTVNRGVRKAEGEIVILLNNDVVPEKDFLKPLEKNFADPKVFAISFHEPNWSWGRLKWVNGFVEHEPGPKTEKVHLSAWASGGSGAFRKSIWEKLGGFDPLYSPFYWEDIDLSYRAWKRGYQVLWEPKSIVHHQHEETISKKFSKDYINFISQRNQLLFIWKNITTPKMVLEHKIYLLKRLLTTPGYWPPFLAALVLKPRVFLREWKEWQEKKVSDKEIFKKF